MLRGMANTIECYVVKWKTSDKHHNLYSYSEVESTKGRISIRQDKEADYSCASYKLNLGRM